VLIEHKYHIEYKIIHSGLLVLTKHKYRREYHFVHSGVLVLIRHKYRGEYNMMGVPNVSTSTTDSTTLYTLAYSC